VGAAPLLEPDTLPANWSYPNVPAMGVILDDADARTANAPTGLDRGSANWPYANEVTTEPLLDMGDLTHNEPTGLAHGHDTTPFNAQARGLGTRGDPKIKKPWLWP